MSEKSLDKAGYRKCVAVCGSCKHFIYGDNYCAKHKQEVREYGFCNSYEWDEEAE